uniref:Uncharacterized protein n=1 Tax=Ditylum brightwellii TaxID=49249 RepID=A0A7S2A1X2_9STRA
MYTVILGSFYSFYSRFLSGAIPDDFLKSIREEDPSVEVVVDLSDNFITDLSSSLTTFTNMNLVLVDSDITSPAPEELCDTDHNGRSGTRWRGIKCMQCHSLSSGVV